MTAPTFVAIDPAVAKPVGWSRWKDGQLDNWGAMELDYLPPGLTGGLYLVYANTAYRGFARHLGYCVGAWAHALGLPRSRTYGVPDRVWRAGLGLPTRGERSALKKAAQAWVVAHLGVPECSDDVAEALALGYWASRHWPEVVGRSGTARRGTAGRRPSTSGTPRRRGRTGRGSARPSGSPPPSSLPRRTASVKAASGSRKRRQAAA